LVASARRALHKRAADVLAHLPVAHPFEICHHLFAAEEWRAAIPIALTAAEEATAACAYQEAAALYERLLPYLTDVGQRVEVLGLLTLNLDPGGEWARARRHLEAEIPVIERAGEGVAAAKLRLRLARTYRLLGRMDLAQAELERAREVVERRGPSGDLAEVYIRLAHLLMLQFETEAGVDAARRGLAIAEEVGDGARVIEASHVLAANLWPTAKEECYRYFERSFELAVAAREFYQAGVALGNWIESLVSDLRLSEAAARIDDWRRVPSTSESQLSLWWREGMLHWRRGELEQAVASYQAAIRGYRERGAEGLVAEVEQLMAVALADLGRFEEGRKVLSDSPVPTAETRLQGAWAKMRLDLDSGDLNSALAETRVMNECITWPLQLRRYLSDLVVEVLIAAGSTPKAREIVAATAELEPVDPYQQRMEGRLALAEGDYQLGCDRLAAACEFWTQAGARLEEARTRRLLGQVKAKMADENGAITELRRAFSLAHRSGAVTEERRARQQLASLGVATEPTASEVKAALEVLHDPAALAASELARAASLVGIETGPELRNLLIQDIQELARGQPASDAEAGRLLLDYYVKRVGSQEVVADRLHLSRRTFYRRLERGLDLLSKHLAGYRPLR
jgi:tetratricopeptide (TPR) repeat protein